MRKLVSTAFIAAILAGVSGAAMAADIPMKAPVLAPAAVAGFNWNGFYFGGNVGYNWGKTSLVDRDGYNTIPGDNWTFRTSGFTGGAQAGWNWYTNPFLFGIEADVGYLNAKGSAPAPAGCTFFACDSLGSTSSDFYATVRGRLGVTVPSDLLLFVTGGFIGINQSTSLVDTCFTAPCGFATINAVDKSFRPGWTGGGGAEWHIPGTQWSVKGEWLYYDVGSRTFSAPNFFPPSTVPSAFLWRWDSKSTGNIVRVGFNWHL